MAEEDIEKNEEATPKRREDAKKKGQVVSSKEIFSVALLWGSIAIFIFYGSHFLQNLLKTIGKIFTLSGSIVLNPDETYRIFLMVLEDLFILMVPFFLFLPLIVVMTQMAQAGMNVTTEPLKWNLSKMNPIKGLKKLFSIRALVELVKSVLKVVLVGALAYLFFKGEIETILSLSGADLHRIFSIFHAHSLKLVSWLAGMLLVIALLDFSFQWWKHEKDLRMSQQEIRDESKQSEGNPLVKSRLKSLRVTLTRNRMISSVGDADVVVTNPQHLAVALSYDQARMKAPRVIAKGAGFIAKRIKEEAEKYKVPIVEDKPLAQTLYKAVNVGQEVPANLYQAVAEILAFVYKLGKLRKVMNG